MGTPTPRFVYENRGEMGDALRIIEHIQKKSKNILDGELRFMKYFVDERLKKLKKSGITPSVN